MWSTGELVEAAAAALAGREEELRKGQAVYGLDALAETALHPLLAAGFRARGFGVIQEQPYPGPAGARPRRSERERCDLVLTPSGGVPLIDPVAQLVETERAAASLFGEVSVPAVPTGCPPSDACWIEVKSIGQNAYQRGVPGPNRGYSGELLQGVVGDAAKLAREGGILHAFAMAVVFAADERSAGHDIEVVVRRCLEKCLVIREWETGAVPITDRVGNRVCVIGMLHVAAGTG